MDGISCSVHNKTGAQVFVDTVGDGEPTSTRVIGPKATEILVFANGALVTKLQNEKSHQLIIKKI